MLALAYRIKGAPTSKHPYNDGAMPDYLTCQSDLYASRGRNVIGTCGAIATREVAGVPLCRKHAANRTAAQTAAAATQQPCSALRRDGGRCTKMANVTIN